MGRYIFVCVLAAALSAAAPDALAAGFSSCTNAAGNPLSGDWPASTSGSQKWKFHWSILEEGIEISNVQFNGKPVLTRGSLPLLPAQYPNPAPSCPGNPHYFTDKLTFLHLSSINNKIKNQTCCGPVPTTICNVPDRGKACEPKNVKLGGCPSGTSACNGLCLSTQVYASSPIESGVGEVGSDDATADVVLTATFVVGNYQFVQRWRFLDNGTIIPSVRLGGLQDCQYHHHQVYWRFDFDLVTTNQSEKVEQCDPATGNFADTGAGSWSATGCQCSTRSPALAKPRWRITDAGVAGRSIIVETGANEGDAARFCNNAAGCQQPMAPGACTNVHDFCILPKSGTLESFMVDGCQDQLSSSPQASCATALPPNTNSVFWYFSQVNGHDPCVELPMCHPAIGQVAFGPTIRLVGSW